MSNQISIRTQILIFTLFGDYVLPLEQSAWTMGLLELLHVLGVSERAGRSTLSRMKQKGWLASERVGRYSRYFLTEPGLRVVNEGATRIFEAPKLEWDGNWHMVVYSIPEEKREIRSKLRQRLGWLGFGRLAPGTWISPNSPQSDIDLLFEELGAEPYALHFGGMTLYTTSNEEIVQKCWDLVTLNEDYARFIDKYQSEYLKFKKARDNQSQLEQADCFEMRFWLTLEYSQFPRRDPNLPPPLLASDWQGGVAADLFTKFRELLREPSDGFVLRVLGEGPKKI
jgi:phenylacetic acid degradation operon negative regulatory protein